MNDLDNPNQASSQGDALRAVRERKQLEEQVQEKFHWPTGADWVLMLVLPIAIMVISAIFSWF